MNNRILSLVWTGFWQGVGVEVSFLLLWVSWHLLHRQVAHKLDPEHWFHVVHDYLTK